jgi:hypothetical protein
MYMCMRTRDTNTPVPSGIKYFMMSYLLSETAIS